MNGNMRWRKLGVKPKLSFKDFGSSVPRAKGEREKKKFIFFLLASQQPHFNKSIKSINVGSRYKGEELKLSSEVQECEVRSSGGTLSGRATSAPRPLCLLSQWSVNSRGEQTTCWN